MRVPCAGLAPSLGTPEHWRKRAEEARIIAEHMDEPTSKAAIIAIAQNYGGLAGMAPRADKYKTSS